MSTLGSQVTQVAHVLTFALVCSLATAGCSDDASSSTDGGAVVPAEGAAPVPTASTTAPLPSDGGADGTSEPPSAGDDQTPATGSPEAVRAWLDKKLYTKWACEPSPHPRRPGSGHAANRICSNARLSGHGTGEFPVGAASVKELYDSSGAPSGYAMAVKQGQGGGEAWYWYELIGESVVANGKGDSGSAKSICVSCHAGAGQNGQSGHDQVFTQVR
jgi:hypothetical protein